MAACIGDALAMIERRFWFLEVESFLITENIAGGTPMDDYLVRRFSGDLSKEMLREKRALLWDIGDLVRRLHQAGLTHMDLYLCHIFVSRKFDYATLKLFNNIS